MEDVRVLIVDDEEGARESLSNILEKYILGVKIVAKSESIASALEKIKKHKPELVFLDIEMPFGSGFELLERIRPIDFSIVFVTAYDHYAIQAIKYSVLDYLLKPVDIEDLQKTINRHKKSREIPQTENYDNLIKNLKSEPRQKKIGIPDINGIIFIAINEIIRCESDGNYTLFFLKSGKKQIASQTLGEYEELLSPNGFFRVHRGHVINLDHITKFSKTKSTVEMSDGSSVDVSRRKKQSFIEVLKANKNNTHTL